MTGRAPTIDQECVEGYLFATPPLRLLLFRRPPERGGIWVPVSGKVEPEDADFEAALRRELSEETGLERPRRVVDLDWSVEFAHAGGRWRLHAFAVEVEPGFVPRLSAEHDAAAWVDPEDAEGRLSYDDNRAAVRRLAAGPGRDAEVD